MTTTRSLLTGTDVDTASEPWRHECECRWLLSNKRTKADMHTYLFGVPDRAMLFTSAGKLRDDASSLWPRGVKPLMAFRSLEAADRLLTDARRLHVLLRKSAA